MSRIAVLHGAGYVGRELIRLLIGHPRAELTCVTSRSFAGKPLDAAHPELRSQHSLKFSGPEDADLEAADAVLVAAEHTRGAAMVAKLLSGGFEGPVIDLSADHRFVNTTAYETLYGVRHPAPEQQMAFQYGVPEIFAPYGCRCIANPGCFATGMLLSLWPLHTHLGPFTATVIALTGASGSGARPKPATHYPTRDGNVRAYKALSHQHLPEITQFLNPDTRIAFVPVSGPWTRGIWGLVQMEIGVDPAAIGQWYKQVYGAQPFVRLWPDTLPELRAAVHTPFCDIGWVVRDQHLVIGFALDNLLKGAASQAIQNLNLLMGWPHAAGLLLAS